MFKYKLSPESRQRIDRQNAERSRLYGLTNVWLATAILALARDAQKSTPEHQPAECTYNSRLIWGVIPEISRRLGIVKLHTKEIDWEIRELSNYELRVRTGYCLANIGDSRLPGWDILTLEVVNGNPVAYAVDRLCPGKMGDREDPIVRRLTEIAAVRDKPFDGVWTPELC